MADELILGAKMARAEVYAMEPGEVVRFYKAWMIRLKAMGGLG
jgi:hypothetical protein